MTGISFAVREAFLLSTRTASYIDALLREGDKFDYSRWLQRVREEETQAKQRPVTSAPFEPAAPEIGTETGTSDAIRPKTALATRAMPFSKAFWQAAHTPKSKAPQIRIRHRLEKMRDAWDEFQSGRARDAVYGYLETVFAIVRHYKIRRKTKKLLRHAFKFAKLPFDEKADPFTAVIRCTSDGNADSKTISKWARALRYAGRSKKPEVRLTTFMKEVGGVNACASLYAQRALR